MTAPDFDAIDRMLFAPGAPFEIVTEEVLGEKMPTFKQRKLENRINLSGMSLAGDRAVLVGQGGVHITGGVGGGL